MGDGVHRSSAQRIIALRRLNAAPRSRAELAEDLRKRGIPE
ncbi:MAG: hypothetical protein ACKOW5_08040, partial [Actinomycetales bacterium]